MRVVLDTNIIVSRYLTPLGHVARIVELWARDNFDLLVSDVILTEYARVLSYPRLRSVHRLTDDQLAEIDSAWRTFAVLISPEKTPAVVEDDPDDDHFLACAVYGHADCLVTGDLHLLRLGSYEDIPILPPADFLRTFFPDASADV